MAINIKKQTPNEVDVMLNKSEAFVIKYKKFLIAIVLGLVSGVLGFLLYSNFSESAQDEASTALAAGQEYFMAQDYETALKGDKKGYKGFLYVADEYSSTKAGNLANLYAGLCYANQEKWEDAVKYLEDFSTKGDAMVSPAALFALGNAYANTKQLDKAVETMKKAASKADAEIEGGANNSLSPTFLLRAADILISQNKNDAALAIYQDIKKKYVQSTAAQEIDKYIESVSQK
mgnify:CR=1 FL=1